MKQFLKNLRKILFTNLITYSDLPRENMKDNSFNNVNIMPSTIISGNNTIGEYTYIGYNGMITSSNIGRYCSIAGNVSIGIGEHKIDRVSTNSIFYKDPFKTLTEKDCIIGNDVWIGVNVVIRRGVVIGNGAIIGANSFVNKDVKPFEIVAGTPAKHIKMRFREEQIKLINESEWWNADLSSAKNIIDNLEETGLFERNN